MRQHIRDGFQTVIVHAATATGKSRLVPHNLQFEIRGKLLVVTPTTVDVVGMQLWAQWHGCHSRYRLGGKKVGGVPEREAKIVFTTAGLASKWYASKGERFLNGFTGILFDEMDRMEENPEFALLWEIALQIQSGRWFLIAGVSATFSDHLLEIL